MSPVLVSVDKAGDLKLGRKKCRLHKKAEVVKVAKKYGIVQAEKLTIKEMCDGLKIRAKNSPLAKDLLRHAAKRGVRTDNLHLYNNVPLAKLYPEAAKKRAAAKKKAVTPSMKAALKKKAVTNFMKGMVTTNSNIKKLRELNEKPSKKAQPLTKDEAIKRIMAMKGLQRNAKMKLVSRVGVGARSPRRVVKVARELSRLNAPAYRVVL
ncbi:hypothetical protein MPVG_00228 [Micromonas pusilla virus 12T]|jgi:hypothetical protein|uniref:hypothetical protein n=1 Tax=Micromonas pusilla virus 12T TaxID=755272 RepID=UPI00014C6669|nr:hypothetical protein MPVG_00228 [Micromonas pusilla virus 12T]AGH31047.1 hypothetical protein MPVG_00228 [Micromonas pusilla virus 12T]